MKKLIKNFLLIFFIINIIQNVQAAKYKYYIKKHYEDILMGLANDEPVSRLELKRFIKKSELIFKVKYKKKIDISFFNSIFASKVIAKQSKQESRRLINEDQIKKIYLSFLRQRNVQHKNFNTEVREKKLSIYEIIEFLTENSYLERLFNNIYLSEITLSNDEMDYYFKQSNTRSLNFLKYLTTHDAVIFFIKKNKISELKTISSIINNKNKNKTLRYLIKKNNIKISAKKFKTNEYKFKKLFLKSRNKNFVGPINTKKYVIMIKILKKNVIFSTDIIDYRIARKFINKKSQKKISKNLSHFFISKHKLARLGKKINKNMKKIKLLKSDYLNNLKMLNEEKAIRFFDINSSYKPRIIENKLGLYLIKPIEKQYSKNSKITQPIVKSIKLYKYKKHKNEAFRMSRRTSLYKLFYYDTIQKKT